MSANNLFRSIAKKVHPDLNGNTVDANMMMQEAIKNRNNVDMLMTLARKWGLKLDGNFDDTVFDKNSRNDLFEIIVGAIINLSFTYRNRLQRIKGVIVKIRPITSGRLKGAKEYSIYDFRTRSIWKHKCRNEPGFEIVGMAPKETLQAGLDTQERIKDSKKARSVYNQMRADNQFRHIGLQKNKNYSNLGKMALVNYKGGAGWREIVRTTAKCVFIRERFRSDERRINVKSVLEVRDKYRTEY